MGIEHSKMLTLEVQKRDPHPKVAQKTELKA